LAYEVKLEKNVKKYLKKLKNRELKEKFLDVIFDELAVDPYIGEQKHGDLKGYWSYGFTYAKTAYRIGYTIRENKILPILIAGSHENFYKEFKRIIK
jgi:addiction module RelE/StbE family toxin